MEAASISRLTAEGLAFRALIGATLIIPGRGQAVIAVGTVSMNMIAGCGKVFQVIRLLNTVFIPVRSDIVVKFFLPAESQETHKSKETIYKKHLKTKLISA